MTNLHWSDRENRLNPFRRKVLPGRVLKDGASSLQLGTKMETGMSFELLNIKRCFHVWRVTDLHVYVSFFPVYDANGVNVSS